MQYLLIFGLGLVLGTGLGISLMVIKKDHKSDKLERVNLDRYKEGYQKGFDDGYDLKQSHLK